MGFYIKCYFKLWILFLIIISDISNNADLKLKFNLWVIDFKKQFLNLGLKRIIQFNKLKRKRDSTCDPRNNNIIPIVFWGK